MTLLRSRSPISLVPLSATMSVEAAPADRPIVRQIRLEIGEQRGYPEELKAGRNEDDDRDG